jgi:ech hydrogenase subunit A
VGFILFLIFVPLLTAIALLFVKNETLRGIIVRASAIVIAAASIYTAVVYFKDGLKLAVNNEWINYGMMAVEALLCLLIVAVSLKHKKYSAVILALFQTPAVIWFEITHREIGITSDIIIDRLSLIMILITGIIGSLICVYALTYMKDYHQHHKDVKERTPFFFFLLFAFLSSMFGIVISNNLIWMYFFWEVTTLCSFFLIGYTKSEEAVKNSFKALIMNLFGGFGFAFAIIFVGMKFGILELSKFTGLAGSGVNLLIPAVLFSIAGLTKSAQMPFSGWLTGAMVAPTPSSALLHSSTMVKAGVFLLIRIAPVLGYNVAGIMVMMVGGITFLLASFIAITQSDGKKVLAYSTISNLGLIVACAGIGSYESIWAGILLIIFHAVSKSLLFLCVGTVEHNMGSRDIEDMHGLIVKLPEMAVMMTIGIAGMFVAPFGMLISKWAALKAFIDSNNILIVMILVFGSSSTMFYWTKWLGKLVAVLNKSERIDSELSFDEKTSLGSLSAMTVVTCFAFPLIASKFIEPYLNNIFAVQNLSVISSGNIHIMMIMLGMILLLPMALIVFVKTRGDRIVTSYMAGVNEGDNRHFIDAYGKSEQMYLSNWYMYKYFNEEKLLLIGNIVTAAVLAVIFAMALGGVL